MWKVHRRIGSFVANLFQAKRLRMAERSWVLPPQDIRRGRLTDRWLREMFGDHRIVGTEGPTLG